MAIGQSAEALAKSLEEQHALKGELDQICNVAQVIVSKVFGSALSTSTLTIRLAEVPDDVWAAYLPQDVLRDIGGADFGGDAPPGPGLRRHLQWVH